MTRRFTVLLHTAYWAIYVLLILVVLSVLRVQFPRTPSVIAMLLSPIGLLTLAPNALAFYAGHGFVFPRFLARQRLLPATLFSVACALASAMLGLLALYAWLGSGQPVFSSLPETSGLLVPLAAVALLHLAAALVIRGFVGWYTDLKLKEELTRRTRDMEMALVRSKVDPHFLFNTLNNIDALISKDPRAASDYLNRLSEILRFVLYETRADTIPLAAELAYIEKYIALERIRTSHPGFVRCDVSGSADGLMIAPMVLIPIIENAFKHTDDRLNDSAIQIAIAIEGRELRFQCRNAVRERPASTPADSGLGNDLIQQRLSLLYPERHTIEIDRGREVYTVSLRLNLDGPPLHHR